MSDKTQDQTDDIIRGHCPMCGKQSLRDFRPFCSARCKNLDLHRWLSGAYAIPGPSSLPVEDEEEEQ